MAQSDQVIENATFPSLRADINDNLSALYSNSAGASEPSVTTGSMFWVDTTNNCLKMRSEDDSSWYAIYKTDGTQLYASGSTAALPAYSKYDDVNSGLFFPGADVVAISTNATERMRIASNGNIGVGTTSPARPFSVTDQTSDGTGGIKISSYLPVLEMDDISGGGTSLIIEHNQANTIFMHDSTVKMKLWGDGTIDMGINSNSTAGVRVFSSGIVDHYLNGTGTSHTIRFYRNVDVSTTFVGSITTNGSSTSYNTSSDYRLKENVSPIIDGLSRLMQLKPSRFNFISDKDKIVDGFIANELEDIVPESVTGVKDGMKEVGNITDRDGKVIEEKVEKPENLKEGQKWQKTGEEPEYQGIDQSKLVPLVVAAVQQLKKEIEDLKNN